MTDRSLLDVDPMLRRFERTALVFCAAAAAVALAVRRGNPDVALGVLGGGLIVAVSYRAIKSGIDGAVGLVTGSVSTAGDDGGLPVRLGEPVSESRAAGEGPPGAVVQTRAASAGDGAAPAASATSALPVATRARLVAGALVRFVGRWGLLALLAYVMIVKVRLNPVGLFIGVSSLVVSAAVEAGRFALGRTGDGTKPRA